MNKRIICDLYSVMQKKGIKTVSELQRFSGLPRRTIDKSLHNESKQINHNTALTLCDALDCEFHELYKVVNEEEYKKIMNPIWKQQEYLASGYVYFVKHKGFNFIKIGKTSDLELRLKQLRQEFGNIELVHSIETESAIELEKYFHHVFADKRTDREWFDISEQDLLIFKK